MKIENWKLELGIKILKIENWKLKIEKQPKEKNSKLKIENWKLGFKRVLDIDLFKLVYIRAFNVYLFFNTINLFFDLHVLDELHVRILF